MQADPRTHAGVLAALETMTDAYARRDLDAVLSCFVPDDDLVLYGTGTDEKRVGREDVKAQVERDWSQSESTAMHFGPVSISCAGPVAWASTEGEFHVRAGGQEFRLPARVSLVFEDRDGRWLIAHGHFSTPMASQAEDSSF